MEEDQHLIEQVEGRLRAKMVEIRSHLMMSRVNMQVLIEIALEGVANKTDNMSQKMVNVKQHMDNTLCQKTGRRQKNQRWKSLIY